MFITLSASAVWGTVWWNWRSPKKVNWRSFTPMAQYNVN